MQLDRLHAYVLDRTNWFDIYFFVTSVLAISTAVMLGFVFEIGFALLPIVDTGALFQVILFWVSCAALALIISRNWVVAFFKLATARDGFNGRADITFRVLYWVVTYIGYKFIFPIAVLIWIFAEKSKFAFDNIIPLVVSMLACITFVYFTSRYRPAFLLIFYTAFLFFCAILSQGYVKIIRSSQYYTYLYVNREPPIPAKILMSSDKGIFFYAAKRDQLFFKPWGEIRCISIAVPGSSAKGADVSECASPEALRDFSKTSGGSLT